MGQKTQEKNLFCKNAKTPFSHTFYQVPIFIFLVSLCVIFIIFSSLWESCSQFHEVSYTYIFWSKLPLYDAQKLKTYFFSIHPKNRENFPCMGENRLLPPFKVIFLFAIEMEAQKNIHLIASRVKSNFFIDFKK